MPDTTPPIEDETAELAANLLDQIDQVDDEATAQIPVHLLRAVCAGYLCLYLEAGGDQPANLH